MKKNILKTVAGIVVAAIFLFLALKDQPLSKIFGVVLKAKIGYVLLAFVFYFISYIARSEKWRIQVENLNFKVCPKTSFYAMILHYFTNSFTIKLGGFVRCVNLRKTANVPFPSCFGSYLSECVFDFIFLIVGLISVLTIQFGKISDILTKLFNDWGIVKILDKPFFLILFATGIIALLALTYLLYKKDLILKNYKNKVREFVNTVKKTFKIKKFWIFLCWNFILWIMLFFMNLFLFKSLFSTNTTFIFIYTITTFTYVAWLIPSPGGIGSVEYFLLQAFLLYGLTKTSALAFGILSNGFTLLSTLFIGFSLIIIQTIFKIFEQKNKNPELEKI